jgi:Ca-activated chloride channel family protein
MRRRLLAAGVASLAVSAAHAAQPSRFHADTRLVVLHATVRNDRGVPVTNLDRRAFTVYENGERQPIAVFRRDDVPVSLGLLIDNSGSMRTVRARVEAAALAFVRASNPDDEVFVINFADRPRLDVAMTSDVHAIEAGIARVDSIGGTALLDAVDAAETYLRAHATRDRKALLIVTDGKDNASEKTMKQIQDAAERSDTVVHAVGLFDEGDASAKQGRKELDDLTARTGGASYYPADVDEIHSVVLELAHQIRQQYTIGYTPTNQALDGSYRTIRVEARGAERLVVRTRAGYRASASPH